MGSIYEKIKKKFTNFFRLLAHGNAGIWQHFVLIRIFLLYTADEYNNNENGLSNDILKLLKAADDSSSQISKSLQRQDTSDTSVDLNIFNDEMRLRNNFENMYQRKGKRSLLFFLFLKKISFDRVFLVFSDGNWLNKLVI